MSSARSSGLSPVDWTQDDYRDWLTETLCHSLLPPTEEPPSSGF
ncbi:hypothetical protein [Actinokineospora sp.]